jgi:hypothetical protein
VTHTQSKLHQQSRDSSPVTFAEYGTEIATTISCLLEQLL